MKVVFLSQRVPYPPDRGDRITTHHFLTHLLARGAEVRVGCLAETDADCDGAAELGKRVAAIEAPGIKRSVRKAASLIGIVRGEALTLPFFRVRALQRAVSRWLREDPPDLVYVYSSSMAQYALDWTGGVRLMQFAELDSDKWRQFAETARGPSRWIYRREADRLLAFERRVARVFDISCVVSEVERELFRKQVPGVDPIVLPNGVDVEHFASRGDLRREPHTLVFTGVMDYEPNVDAMVWFVSECWPAILARHADAKLRIVGSHPSAEVLRLRDRPRVEVTGRVPETPPYFDTATVAIAPLRLGRGLQNKVLEAMSMSLPVVSSPVAAQGIGADTEAGLIVADGAESTTNALLELLDDPPRARALGARAAAHVREHFRWERMYARLDEELAKFGL